MYRFINPDKLEILGFNTEESEESFFIKYFKHNWSLKITNLLLFLYNET